MTVTVTFVGDVAQTWRMCRKRPSHHARIGSDESLWRRVPGRITRILAMRPPMRHPTRPEQETQANSRACLLRATRAARPQPARAATRVVPRTGHARTRATRLVLARPKSQCDGRSLHWWAALPDHTPQPPPSPPPPPLPPPSPPPRQPRLDPRLDPTRQPAPPPGGLDRPTIADLIAYDQVAELGPAALRVDPAPKAGHARTPPGIHRPARPVH